MSANSKDEASGHRCHPFGSYPFSVQRVEFKTCEPIRSKPEPCLKCSVLNTADVILFSIFLNRFSKILMVPFSYFEALFH